MVDQSAASVAQDIHAPAGERYDANADLTHTALQSLIPSAELQPIIDHINDQFAEADFAKSIGSNVYRFPGAKRPAPRGAQSVIVDDQQIGSQGQWWDRPGLLNFDSMRAMVDQTPILNSIVQTRIRQVLRFCRPQMSHAEAGFVIQHVDRTVELNDDQQKSIQILQSFVTNCGWEQDPRRRKRLKRDNFSQFMARSVRDSLTMDACPIETEFKRDRSLGLDGFYAIDGGTVRLCTEQGYEGDDEIFALQVIQGTIRGTYNYDQLIYEVRNPRTDVTASGYGYGESEMLIRVVTYMLNTMTYNGSFFDKNSIPRGVLNLYGNYDQADLAAFKRYWNAMVRGIQNVHNMPVMVSKDSESKAEFTEIGGQLDEMAFQKWVTLLTSICCAIYGISPEEISMESFATSKSSLGGSDTQEKIVSSNDKGLRPLLTFYENLFSDFIIQAPSPEYNLRFMGLDGDDEKSRFEMRKLTLTLNEGRIGDGYDAIEGPLGDAPLNPVLIPVWQAITGIGQPEPEQEDFGDPDAGAPEPGADDVGETDDTPDPDQDDMAKALDFGLPIYRIED